MADRSLFRPLICSKMQDFSSELRMFGLVLKLPTWSATEYCLLEILSSGARECWFRKYHINLSKKRFEVRVLIFGALCSWPKTNMWLYCTSSLPLLGSKEWNFPSFCICVTTLIFFKKICAVILRKHEFCWSIYISDLFHTGEEVWRHTLLSLLSTIRVFSSVRAEHLFFLTKYLFSATHHLYHVFLPGVCLMEDFCCESTALIHPGMTDISRTKEQEIQPSIQCESTFFQQNLQVSWCMSTALSCTQSDFITWCSQPAVRVPAGQKLSTSQ